MLNNLLEWFFFGKKLAFTSRPPYKNSRGEDSQPGYYAQYGERLPQIIRGFDGASNLKLEPVEQVWKIHGILK